MALLRAPRLSLTPLAPHRSIEEKLLELDDYTRDSCDLCS